MKKTTLFKKMFIHLFWNLRLFFVFLPTMLRQACQNFIVHVQTNNLTNRFFGKFIIFSSFPDFEQKLFRSLTRFFWQGCHNCILRVQMKIFSTFEGRKREKIFFSKKLHCYLFHNLNEEDPQCSCKHGYGRLVKNSLYMFRRTFLQLGFLGSLSFFRHFRNSSKKFSEFWRECFDGMVTTTFYMYRSTISAKIYFFRKIHKFSRRFLESERQIWGYFGKNFLVWLSRLHSLLLENHFWWKKKSDQKIVTSFFLELGKVLRVFGDNFTAGLSKFLCTCSDKDFEEK